MTGPAATLREDGRRGASVELGRRSGAGSLLPVRPCVRTAVPLDLVVCDELAMLVAAAREVAWQTHCNVVGIRYLERKEAVARLRGCLSAYDQARGAR